MKYQSLFSGKNKKNRINLSSTEFAQRVVKVKLQASLLQGHQAGFVFRLPLWAEKKKNAAKMQHGKNKKK